MGCGVFMPLSIIFHAVGYHLAEVLRWERAAQKREDVGGGRASEGLAGENNGGIRLILVGWPHT